MLYIVNIKSHHMRHLTPLDIGALARQARTAAGLTQTQLGARIGASRFWVAEFEHGKAGAELGLVLKALRALGLAFTVGPKEIPRSQTPVPAVTDHKRTALPMINLAEVLARSTSLTYSPPRSAILHVIHKSRGTGAFKSAVSATTGSTSAKSARPKRKK